MVDDKDDSFLNVAAGVFHCQNIPSVVLTSHDRHHDDDFDHPGDHQHVLEDDQLLFSQSQLLFRQFKHSHCPVSQSLFSQCVFFQSALAQE